MENMDGGQPSLASGGVYIIEYCECNELRKKIRESYPNIGLFSKTPVRNEVTLRWFSLEGRAKLSKLECWRGYSKCLLYWILR